MRLFQLPHVATTDDWYTPPWVFEELGEVFDLDVAAPPGGVPWIPADAYFTLDDDGLAQDWYGFVWCNPPYSAPTAWCDRWAAHGNGIILIRSDLSTRGPSAVFRAATSMLVPTPRIQFVNEHGDTPGAADSSHFLFAAGARADVALRRLNTKGIYRRLL